ncbi:pyruvate dehydrogenase (acetyl-transferring) E1 component subunit alpha [Litchfieldella rifensis]|uniref:Pyruvate dehydrogenase E1 component subunit alpha n=1 Tax=Litchfieldella rifensis TaxID=762643 RepID=A0ABV7LS59_9GAMM
MPRKQVRLEHSVEYLSIMDKRGRVDEKLAPQIDDERLQQMHRTMLLSRRLDERMLTLQRQGRIGTFAPAIGQEGCQVAAMAALSSRDWFVPAFRETSAMLWRGFDPVNLLLYNAGYNEGGAIPEDSHDLPISIPVASQLPPAVGLAYGAGYRENDEIVITFFGDGATSEGDFHEAMNFASVFKTPVIFLCQNNHWAISMPRRRQSGSRTLAQKALAYGIPALQVDGNDVFAVYAAVQEAAKRARDGGGPTMIEAVTYRMSVHTTADDPGKYRDEKEVKQWQELDPILRLQKYLKARKRLTDKEVDKLEEEIEQEVDEAWEKADQRMQQLDDPSVIFDHLYEQPPEYLEAQREAFEQRLKSEG